MWKASVGALTRGASRDRQSRRRAKRTMSPTTAGVVPAGDIGETTCESDLWGWRSPRSRSARAARRSTLRTSHRRRARASHASSRRRRSRRSRPRALRSRRRPRRHPQRLLHRRLLLHRPHRPRPLRRHRHRHRRHRRRRTARTAPTSTPPGTPCAVRTRRPPRRRARRPSAATGRTPSVNRDRERAVTTEALRHGCDPMTNRGGWSWKRQFGVTAAKRRVSRATGIPWTRSGRQRKVGALFWKIFR
jgi:hypothetical protein